MAVACVGVGFWKGAGVPEGKRSNVFVECGCCGAYHRADFWGDCREDAERYPVPPLWAREVVELPAATPRSPSARGSAAGRPGRTRRSGR